MLKPIITVAAKSARWLRPAALVLGSGSALIGASAAQASADDVLNRYYAAQANDPAAAFTALSAAAATYPDDPRIQLEAGYHLLRQKQPAEALPWFERAAVLQPARADLARQIGYIRKELGQNADALAAFEQAVELDPADELARAELAYLRQAAAPASNAPADRFFAETYAAPEYNSHWGMAVLPVQARVGVVLADQPAVELYAGVRINVDSRSGAGPFGPEVFTDNMAAVAAGLRVRPLPGLALFVEAGGAYDLANRGRARWRGDLRGGFMYYADWNMAPPPAGLPTSDRRIWGLRPVADVYADGIYYSRYADNVLFSVRARPGLRLAESERLAFDIYLHGAAGFDTKGLRDNRFAELGSGAALRLLRWPGVTLRAEGVQVYRDGGLAAYTTARVRVEHYARF